MTPSPVKAAVVQAGSFLFDTPRTLNKLTELTRDAAGRGAQIVVFPEAFVGGYPKGLDFGGIRRRDDRDRGARSAPHRARQIRSGRGGPLCTSGCLSSHGEQRRADIRRIP